MKMKERKILTKQLSLGNQRLNNTDFYYKLRNLTDNIHKYKVKFGEWQPDHIPQAPERELEESTNISRPTVGG